MPARENAMTKNFKAGDHVKWDTPQGETSGKVVRKETSSTKAGGHVAKATKDEPQFRVKSDKSGKEAVHKPEALKKA
ncbi:DUF2945 domain-containing protein [Sphingomonas sp. IC4-52]|uniref:DUF2945 domain-containing protein n=2 Tax=unclassified Sphingomonas TaxID=196159 RepID=UPI001D11A0AF|nr:DUF2945 domain-containing protein [Sphingomonas sp. IC4-52]MCC2979481.1 DUF2945 domain-containing protein [Sphingomonas sp. IC4-52]